jgi:hypothetical protein
MMNSGVGRFDGIGFCGPIVPTGQIWGSNMDGCPATANWNPRANAGCKER